MTETGPTFNDGNKTFSDRKVLFGTTVSITKKGRLASCSHLEWTTQMFTRTNRGKLVEKFNKDESVVQLQLGKCYKKGINETTFSFLLENIYKPGHPITLNHEKYPEGRCIL